VPGGLGPGRLAPIESLALQRADLLTVVMHELGHVLGRGHNEEGLMEERLPWGVRRLWDAPDSWWDDDGNEDAQLASGDIGNGSVDAVFARPLGAH
jgi:hypothetical protein